MNVEGGCVCGSVRYRLLEDPMFIQACHCTGCQRSTGSAFIISMVLESAKLELYSGEPVVSSLTGGSDGVFNLFSCGECGTTLWAGAQGDDKGLVYVRVGTLDNARQVKPMAHIWTRSKHEWVILPTDVPVFKKMYELEEVWPDESLRRLAALSGTGQV
jgi:hypothetical protein